MSDPVVIPVPEEWAKKAYADDVKYRAMHASASNDPEAFWGVHGQRLDWIKPYTKVKDTSFDEADFHIRWYEDGVLNVSANCIDRHLEARGDQTAIIWEGDDPEHSARITYRELHAEVCRFANVLKKRGVTKGDRVTIYMPMIPEAAYAMLACARIGAIHSVVFGGFSPESLANRIKDCDSRVVITADEGVRGGKIIPLKANVDAALEHASGVTSVIVVTRTGAGVAMQDGRDIVYEDEAATVSAECAPEPMNAEDPLFILYTSGSTGKPKGVLHTTGGYLVYASMTHQYVFDYHDGDIYWCTADVGWVTGHTYIVYGPLANGATTLIFEGVPNHPTSSRFWEVIDKHQVNTFYTAPTAIRALMRDGEAPVKRTSRASLRLIGTVGEPINPEAWLWYYRTVGDSRCPVVDTWWQTETGAALITNLPGATAMKPGSATRPFFGIKPALVNDKGEFLEGAASGNLVLLDSWPGQMRTVYGDHQRFFDTYFRTYPGMYFTGDGCRRDEDGYYWITGRVDDVLNVSGHRIGTAEIESALVSDTKVAEAAVVGYPHDIKGQGIYCFVTLKAGVEASDELKRELVQTVRQEIGPTATPDIIQWAPGLPKTRSGKIMRRILRKIAENDLSNLGDTSTLADPSVVDDLVANRGDNAMGRWIDEGLKLYAVFVGGSHARATIELHDVQFAVASRIEDTVPALRQRWWGTPSSLHIDAYAELRVVDGYSITPVPPGDAPKSDLALYFVNTGGYQDGVFGESHAYSFHVSADKKEVWRNAKQRAADFSSIHQDNFDRIDDVVCVDEVIEDQPWRLAYNLLPGSENAKPLIVARYKSL